MNNHKKFKTFPSLESLGTTKHSVDAISKCYYLHIYDVLEYNIIFPTIEKTGKKPSCIRHSANKSVT